MAGVRGQMPTDQPVGGVRLEGLFLPDRWNMAVLESGPGREATLQLWWENTNHSGS